MWESLRVSFCLFWDKVSLCSCSILELTLKIMSAWRPRSACLCFPDAGIKVYRDDVMLLEWILPAVLLGCNSRVESLQQRLNIKAQDHCQLVPHSPWAIRMSCQRRRHLPPLWATDTTLTGGCPVVWCLRNICSLESEQLGRILLEMREMALISRHVKRYHKMPV